MCDQIVQTLTINRRRYNIRFGAKPSKNPEHQNIPNYHISINLGKDPLTGKQKQRQLTSPTLEGIIEKLNKETGNIPASDRQKHITVSQWLEHSLAMRSLAYSPSSIRDRRSLIKKYLGPAIGQNLLDETSEIELLGMYQEFLAHGMKTNRIREINSFLSKCFEEAARKNLIPYNPCLDIQMPRATHAERLPIWKEEIADFMLAAYHTPFYDLFAVLLATGMRISEALGLSWNDLDRERKTLFIHQQAQQTDEYGKACRKIRPMTKNYKPRLIPIADDLLQHFDSQRFQQEQNSTKHKDSWDNPDNLVFTNAHGGQILQNTVQNYLKKVAAAINRQDVSLHSLRHTYLTFVYDEVRDITSVQFLAGHASLATTTDYIHAYITKDRQVKLAITEELKLMHQKVCGHKTEPHEKKSQ